MATGVPAHELRLRRDTMIPTPRQFSAAVQKLRARLTPAQFNEFFWSSKDGRVPEGAQIARLESSSHWPIEVSPKADFHRGAVYVRNHYLLHNTTGPDDSFNSDRSFITRQPWLEWVPAPQELRYHATGATERLVAGLGQNRLFRGCSMTEFRYCLLIKRLVTQGLSTAEVKAFRALAEEIASSWRLHDDARGDLARISAGLERIALAPASERREAALALVAALAGAKQGRHDYDAVFLSNSLSNALGWASRPGLEPGQVVVASFALDLSSVAREGGTIYAGVVEGYPSAVEVAAVDAHARLSMIEHMDERYMPSRGFLEDQLFETLDGPEPVPPESAWLAA
jgi:hypothetical protein